MENQKNKGFWKGFVLGGLLIILIGTLAVIGINGLMKKLNERQQEGGETSGSLPVAESTTGGQPGTATTSTEEPAASGEETTPAGRTIDRNSDPFLKRMNQVRELFLKNQVLDYDINIMEQAALKAYIEGAGENWSDYENSHPSYGPEVTLIPWNGLDFINRLGELSELLEERTGPRADQAQLMDGAYRAFVEASGDVYSAYLTAQEWADMQESSSGSYCGVGIMVSQNQETMACEVVTVFAGSPALEVGIKAGDVIIGVDGMDITQTPLEEIVIHIRGEEGTKVDLTVFRPSTGETLTFSTERRMVEVETVYYRMLTENVGYIELTEFDEVSVDQVRNAIRQLSEQGMEKLVFDLRGNPGGLLTSVLDIADFFVPAGLLIFRMDYIDGEAYTEKSATRPIFDGDMVVLADRHSASASEVLTGILQDYHQATIMGETTYGKGIVQSFYVLDGGGALKVTIAHYFSPTGRDFHGVGIDPDIPGEDDPATEEDELINQALEYLNK